MESRRSQSLQSTSITQVASPVEAGPVPTLADAAILAIDKRLSQTTEPSGFDSVELPVEAGPVPTLADGAILAIDKRLSQTTEPSGFDFLDLGLGATRFDGDLHSIFHRIFEGHFDSEEAVLVDRFSFAGFHWPSQSQG